MRRFLWTISIISVVCCVTESINSTSAAGLAKTEQDFGQNSSAITSFTCPVTCNCSTVEENESMKSVTCIEADLTMIPADWLRYADKIKLELNHFHTLNHSDKDWSRYQIVYLNLKANEIVDIDQTFFQRFIKLETLILSDNYISTLDWTIDLKNTTLVELDLSYNTINKLTMSSFGKLHFLERLDLSHNSISSIGPSSFISIPQLQWLDLTWNEFKVEHIYESSFAGLHNLTNLSLADNKKLERLPNFRAIGLDKSELKYLDLHGLSPLLQTIPAQAFSGLNNLASLNLSYCDGLKDLNIGWLDDGPHMSLETLDLSHDNLHLIRDYYFVATRISQYCSEAQIPVNEGPIIVKHQKFIDVEKRNELYENLPALSWLSLSGNPRLSFFETNSFVFLPSLQYLFLQRCNLSKLNLAMDTVQFHADAIRETYKLLRGIWIFGNPWHCDCHLRNVIDISESYNDPINASGLTTPCENPQNTSKDILYIDKEEYFHEGRCHSVDSVMRATCFPFHREELYWLSHTPRSYLRCPNEPIVLFFAVILGPLSLVAAILFILLCGFCKVYVSRLHRSYTAMYHPKYYYQELRNKKFAMPLSPGLQSYSSFSKKDVRNQQQHIIPHRSPPATEKTSNRIPFQTNMVLGGFNASYRSNHSLTPLLRPFPIFPKKKSPSSPRVKRLQKKNSCSCSPPGFDGTYEHLDVELNTFCSKVDGSSTPKEWIQTTPFSNSNMDISSINSLINSKSNTMETTVCSSSKRDSKSDTFIPLSYAGTNFMPIAHNSQSIPSIHEPSQHLNSEIDLCEIRISESPTIPYIDDDSNIKSAIERFVYQDPLTKAIMPKNTLAPEIILEEKPFLARETHDANANINSKDADLFSRILR